MILNKVETSLRIVLFIAVLLLLFRFGLMLRRAKTECFMLLWMFMYIKHNVIKGGLHLRLLWWCAVRAPTLKWIISYP